MKVISERDQKVEKPALVTVLYFSMPDGLGHIAVMVQHPNQKGEYRIGEFTNLLNYTSGNSEYGRNIIEEIEETKEICKGALIRYALPPLPKDLGSCTVRQLVRDEELASFSVLTNNCVDAARNLLIVLGYKELSVSNTNIIISTPGSLIDQIKNHYCLQKKLDSIFECKQGSSYAGCGNVKMNLEQIFQLAGKKHRLPKKFFEKADWKSIQQSVQKLIDQRPRNSNPVLFKEDDNSIKKLSELLSVVNMYADPGRDLVEDEIELDLALSQTINSSYFF